MKKASDFDGEIYKEALEKLKKCRKGTETDEIHELLQIIEPNNMVPDITINLLQKRMDTDVSWIGCIKPAEEIWKILFGRLS